MMQYLYAGLALIPLWWMVTSAWGLLRNYRVAKRVGLPMIVIPWNIDSAFYVVFANPLRPFWESRLGPGYLRDVLTVTTYGYEFWNRSNIARRIGPSFLVVTPVVIRLHCGDAAMIHCILSRANVWVQEKRAINILGIVGQNLSSSNGEQWQRQRRIVAPSLNERISKLVWDESSLQARQMASYMLAQPGGESRDGADGVRAIATHVLGAVAYGQPQPWKILELPSDPDADIGYTDAVSFLAEFIIAASHVPKSILRSRFMPKQIHMVADVLDKMPVLAQKLLDSVRAAQTAQRPSGHSADESQPRETIASILVRLSDEARSTNGHAPKSNGAAGKQYLTQNEMFGNLFQFTLAGLDTTAFTMTYSIALLAIYPEWQTWIQAELDDVLGPIDPKDDTPVDYNTIFPKLTRCQAFTFEVLRLYTMIVHMARELSKESSILTDTNGVSHELVAPVDAYICTPIPHRDARFWGPDVDEFRPTRWFDPGAAPGAPNPFITPRPGAYVPWSIGPRVCPGQKMAQVEVAAVLSTFLRTCSVLPALEEGETLEQARKRLLGVLEDSQPTITLRPRDKKAIYLKWVRR
ncbi:cytochrome P450 [Lasiosphaeria miniovina]|uniref:Cytochrome P450 n=1 Tax=Lasiosphaeria miniovina TaxID=1954250 RepID=A0AA39ZZ69_9PEZI|nr:cytochrome P450 [Lasiosphaeria miniovina]KAK0706119.1 cytochrome P450 [Lasiosphaeria miniovina]